MTEQQLIELARECGSAVPNRYFEVFEFYPRGLAKFAERIAAREREACAKLCDDRYAELLEPEAKSIAAEIRARGEK